ncbi:MAG: hypothetical protein ACXVEF_07790 [Polyangiales bacterium]
MLRKSTKLGLLALATTAVLSTQTGEASASFIDVGAQAGVMGRSLAGTTYKPGFSFQLHADLALIPPILMLGAYADGIPFGGKLTPDRGTDPQPINFQGGGLRAKLKIPLPGPFTPYGIAGVGFVHANFPDQVISACLPGTAVCQSRTVPSATANFAEFVLGGGAMIELAGPLALTLEATWRPSTGYKNDTYEQQIQNQSTTAPSPSRNGYAWTVHGGLAISL